jgi:hypothetical protein
MLPWLDRYFKILSSAKIGGAVNDYGFAAELAAV